MKTSNQSVFFAPHLNIKVLLSAMRFYEKAFGATVLRQFDNSDGSVHVAEMQIQGAMFHIHEESERHQELSPETLHATTSSIGIFVEDPDAVVNQAIASGATLSSPLQDYDYGYRQGMIVDPFGHHWLVQKKI